MRSRAATSSATQGERRLWRSVADRLIGMRLSMLKCFNDDDDYFFLLLLLLFRGFSSSANAKGEERREEKIIHPESKMIFIRC